MITNQNLRQIYCREKQNNLDNRAGFEKKRACKNPTYKTMNKIKTLLADTWALMYSISLQISYFYYRKNNQFSRHDSNPVLVCLIESFLKTTKFLDPTVIRRNASQLLNLHIPLSFIKRSNLIGRAIHSLTDFNRLKAPGVMYHCLWTNIYILKWWRQKDGGYLFIWWRWKWKGPPSGSNIEMNTELKEMDWACKWLYHKTANSRSSDWLWLSGSWIHPANKDMHFLKDNAKWYLQQKKITKSRFQISWFFFRGISK